MLTIKDIESIGFENVKILQHDAWQLQSKRNPGDWLEVRFTDKGVPTVFIRSGFFMETKTLIEGDDVTKRDLLFLIRGLKWDSM